MAGRGERILVSTSPLAKTRVIILCGPPAVGKLTVGGELQSLTGYRLIHNHLINNLCEAIVDRTSAGYRDATFHVRMHCLSIAMAAGVDGVIWTMLGGTRRLADLGRHEEAIDDTGASRTTVWLTSPLHVLNTRVSEPRRHGTGKICDPEALRRVLEEIGPTLPSAGSNILNTAEVAPHEAAVRIWQIVGSSVG